MKKDQLLTPFYAKFFFWTGVVELVLAAIFVFLLPLKYKMGWIPLSLTVLAPLAFFMMLDLVPYSVGQMRKRLR